LKANIRDPEQNTLDISLPNSNNGANLGFEEKLWKMADKLRNNMDAAVYKHVVLGLNFLVVISMPNIIISITC
jgi:type I restriction-modification system DNA methylase subunit